MAEIRIKKKSGPVWPWILGVLILLATIWFVLEFVLTEEGIKFESKVEERRVEEREKRSDLFEGNEEYRTQTNRIDDFIALVNDKSFIEENVDEEKAKEGMQLLSEALDEVIEEHEIQDQEIMADKHVLSDQVNGNKTGLRGNELRESERTAIDTDLNKSFYTAANLIAGIQQEQFPDLDEVATEVQESVMAIEPSEEISNQGEQVKDFFIKSGKALQSMREGIYQEVYHSIPEEAKLINKYLKE